MSNYNFEFKFQVGSAVSALIHGSGATKRSKPSIHTHNKRLPAGSIANSDSLRTGIAQVAQAVSFGASAGHSAALRMSRSKLMGKLRNSVIKLSRALVLEAMSLNAADVE